MPIWHFRIWRDFDDLYPEGWRAEVAGASVTSVVTNANLAKGKKPVKITDLSPVARAQDLFRKAIERTKKKTATHRLFGFLMKQTGAELPPENAELQSNRNAP